MDRKNNDFDNKENLGHGIKGAANSDSDLKNGNNKKTGNTINGRNNIDELL